MRWWVSLVDESGEPVKVDKFQDGGTQVIGGSEEASLNVTYNYSKFYCVLLDKRLSLNWLNGKKACLCESRLRLAVQTLGLWRDTDYWAGTPGNAGWALNILLEWAVANPEATFRVTQN